MKYARWCVGVVQALKQPISCFLALSLAE